jgi:AMMECR1 domain-containing protein
MNSLLRGCAGTTRPVNSAINTPAIAATLTVGAASAAMHYGLARTLDRE